MTKRALVIALLCLGSVVHAQPVAPGAGIKQVSHDSTLAGSGTVASQLGLAPCSLAGQTWVWNGSTFACTTAGGSVADGDKGDVTVTGSGATWTIDNSVVTLAKMADLAAATIIGRASGAGTGAPTALTGTQVTALLDVVSTVAKGLVPTAPNDATKFLNGLGAWAVPVGTTYTASTGLTLTTTAFSVTTNGITNALLRQSSGLSVIGNGTNVTANVADITAAADGDVLRRSGTTLGFGAIPEGSVTSLTTDLAARALTTRTISTTAPLSGGGDLSANRTLSITTNGIDNTLIRQSAGLSVIGNGSNVTANVADITAGSDGQVLRRSGTTLAFGTVDTAGITAGAVTYPKIQNVSATSRILGRITAGAGSIEELTGTQATTLLDTFSTAATTKGLVAGSNGATAAFLRGDNTWQTISATGLGAVTGSGLTANRVVKAGSGTSVVNTAFPIDDTSTTLVLGDSTGDTTAINGRVGIGTSAPTSDSLGVLNTMYVADNSTAYLRFGSGGSINYIQSGTSLTSGTSAALKITNMSAASTWAQWDSSGNFTEYNNTTLGSTTSNTLTLIGTLTANSTAGSNGQVLTVVSGVPQWAAASSGSLLTYTLGQEGVFTTDPVAWFNNWNPTDLATKLVLQVEAGDNHGTVITGVDAIDNGPSTTIAAGSNGAALPQATINVASTTTFATSGTFIVYVTTSGGQQTVTCTGATSSTFTGCSGGTGTMSTGGSVLGGLPVGTTRIVCNAHAPQDDGVVAFTAEDSGSKANNRVWTPAYGRNLSQVTTDRKLIGPSECSTLIYLQPDQTDPATKRWLFVDSNGRQGATQIAQLGIFPPSYPGTISGTVNDWDPSDTCTGLGGALNGTCEGGLSTASTSRTMIMIQTASSAAVTLTGIKYTGGTNADGNGPIKILYNLGPGNVTLSNGGGSLAANQFSLGSGGNLSNVVLTPGRSIMLFHQRDSGAWLPIDHPDYYFDGRSVTMTDGLTVASGSSAFAIDYTRAATGATTAYYGTHYVDTSTYNSTTGTIDNYGTAETLTAARASGANPVNATGYNVTITGAGGGTSYGYSASVSGNAANYAYQSSLGNIYFGTGTQMATFFVNSADSDFSGRASVQSDFRVGASAFGGTERFKVFGATGNTAISGTLDVTGAINGYTQKTKATDQDVTNSSTLTDDSALTFTTTSTKAYAVEAFLLVSGSSTTGNYKFAFTTSAGTMDGSGECESISTAGAIQNTAIIATAAASVNSVSVGTRASASIPIAVHCWFSFLQNTSSGTFKLQFAQSTATAATVARTMAGSYLSYRQLN